MSETMSRQLCHEFMSAAVDLTPPDVRNEVTLLFLPFTEQDYEPQNCERYSAILSDAERARADRMKRLKDKARFLKGRAFRRYCGTLALGKTCDLSSLRFSETAEGRPYLVDARHIWFSFSASDAGHLAAWSSSCAVGVDIEDAVKAPAAIEMARHYFSKAEADAVTHAPAGTCERRFLQFWTLKEAALKSIGQGLPYGLDAFEFALVPALRMVRVPAEYCGVRRMQARLIAERDICAALVLRNPRLAA